MKKIIFTLLVMLASSGAWAQYNNNEAENQYEEHFRKHKATEPVYSRRNPWELGFNLGFNTDKHVNCMFSINFGKQINQYFAVGVNLNFMRNGTLYFDDDYYDSDYDFDDDSYYEENADNPDYWGFGAYARFRIWKYLAAYSRFELNFTSCFNKNGSHFDFNSIEKSRTVPSVVIGIGPYIPIGKQGRYGFILASVYYDVVQNDYTPYSDKVGISVGYTFTF